MDKELTWEEELEEARAEQPGPQSCIAAQNPLGPSRSRLRRQIATFRGDAVRLLKDARQVLVEIGYLAGDQIEALQDIVRPGLRHAPGRAEAAGDGPRGSYSLRNGE